MCAGARGLRSGDRARRSHGARGRAPAHPDGAGAAHHALRGARGARSPGRAGAARAAGGGTARPGLLGRRRRRRGRGARGARGGGDRAHPRRAPAGARGGPALAGAAGAAGLRAVEETPLQPLLAAFDGAVAPAGYNLAHEVAKAGVPLVLFAMSRPFDDQAGRAARFEAAGLGRVLASADDACVAAAVAWMERAPRPSIAAGGADRAADALLDLAMKGGSVRVAFHAINGVGLGHLVRLTAIAEEVRALHPDAVILVLTNAADPSMLTRAGFDFVRFPPSLTEPHARSRSGAPRPPRAARARGPDGGARRLPAGPRRLRHPPRRSHWPGTRRRSARAPCWCSASSAPRPSTPSSRAGRRRRSIASSSRTSPARSISAARLTSP